MEGFFPHYQTFPASQSLVYRLVQAATSSGGGLRDPSPTDFFSSLSYLFHLLGQGSLEVLHPIPASTAIYCSCNTRSRCWSIRLWGSHHSLHTCMNMWHAYLIRLSLTYNNTLSVREYRRWKTRCLSFPSIVAERHLGYVKADCQKSRRVVIRRRSRPFFVAVSVQSCVLYTSPELWATFPCTDCPRRTLPESNVAVPQLGHQNSTGSYLVTIESRLETTRTRWRLGLMSGSGSSSRQSQLTV